VIKPIVAFALMTMALSAASAQSVTAPANGGSIGIAPPGAASSLARPLRRRGAGQSNNLLGSGLGSQTVLTGVVAAGAAAAAAYGLATALEDHDNQPVSP
jgi:hypothetical protein